MIKKVVNLKNLIVKKTMLQDKTIFSFSDEEEAEEEAEEETDEEPIEEE